MNTPTATKAPPVNGAHPVQDAELVPVRREQANPLAAIGAQLYQRPNLAAALVGAVMDCAPVAHDARNEFHRYDYTSAEAILAAARTALAKNGLAVIPLEASVNGSEREGPDRFELVQQRLLLHTSGESVLCKTVWPIIPDKGRPLDKATASADTTSLAYFLRDLLQMPRVDPADDVSAREDRAPQKAAAPKQEAAPAKPAAAKKGPALPKDASELYDRLDKKDIELSEAGRIKAGELVAHMLNWGRREKLPDRIREWPATHFATALKEAKAFMDAHPAPAPAPQEVA